MPLARETELWGRGGALPETDGGDVGEVSTKATDAE